MDFIDAFIPGIDSVISFIHSVIPGIDSSMNSSIARMSPAGLASQAS